MSWTDERVELLRKLWGEGHTAAEIAKKIGQVTRNAVIGKAHRLNLPSRVSPIRSKKKATIKPANTNVRPLKKVVSKAKKKDAPTVKKNAPQLPKEPEIIGDVKQLDELKAHDCRWPYGDPQTDKFGFCGAQSLEGLPYCGEHAQMAYQAATRNRILKSQKMLKDIEKASTSKKASA